jgi:hypothetical protein
VTGWRKIEDGKAAMGQRNTNFGIRPSTTVVRAPMNKLTSQTRCDST